MGWPKFQMYGKQIIIRWHMGNQTSLPFGGRSKWGAKSLKILTFNPSSVYVSISINRYMDFSKSNSPEAHIY